MEQKAKQWVPVQRVNHIDSQVSEFEANNVLKGLNISNMADAENIPTQREFLNTIAQSSDKLPNDFSTSSLQKFKGLNISA